MEYKVKLTSFLYIGAILITAGLVYIAGMFYSQHPGAVYKEEVLSGGLLGIIVGIIFLFLGSKSRKIVLSEEKFEYWTSKPNFVANYKDIELLKIFSDGERNSKILLIIDKEGNNLSVSSSFFNVDMLKNASIDLHSKLKNSDCEIVDELGWLN